MFEFTTSHTHYPVILMILVTWVQVIFLLVRRWPPFLSQPLPIQWTGNPCGNSSTLQSAVMEKMVVWLLEQLATTQPTAKQATRPAARYAGTNYFAKIIYIPCLGNWQSSETFPGPDKHVRVATVKTISGQFMPLFHKLMLPVQEYRNLRTVVIRICHGGRMFKLSFPVSETA